MAKLEFQAEITCSVCGSALDVKTDIDYRGRTSVSVVPCDTCLDKARDEADEAGYARGQEEATDGD